MINIYCDESCHLEHDLSNVMVLGAMSCPKSVTQTVSKELRNIKIKHKLSPTYELKWSKVGEGKIDYYKDVIDYFISRNDLLFRAVVADKTHLRHGDFAQTHDEWYYKMYYLLLRYMVNPLQQYKVYVDIKDTQGGRKLSKLHEVLNNSLYTFFPECIINIQQVRSDECELLQVVDLLIGAISYKNRNLKTSNAKSELCEYLEKAVTSSLISSSPLANTKFNLFMWGARE